MNHLLWVLANFEKYGVTLKAGSKDGNREPPQGGTMIVERLYEMPDLEQVFRLRVTAWRSRLSHFPAFERWSDDFDAKGLHWGVRFGEQIIAAARLSIHDSLSDVPDPEIYAGILPLGIKGPLAVMTRLVVAKAYAGTGLSYKLDTARIEHARSAGCQHVIGETSPHLPRVHALESLGFHVAGQSKAYAGGPLREAKPNGGAILVLRMGAGLSHG